MLLRVTIVPRTVGAVGVVLMMGGTAAMQGTAMFSPQRWGTDAGGGGICGGWGRRGQMGRCSTGWKMMMMRRITLQMGRRRRMCLLSNVRAWGYHPSTHLSSDDVNSLSSLVSDDIRCHRHHSSELHTLSQLPNETHQQTGVPPLPGHRPRAHPRRPRASNKPRRSRGTPGTTDTACTTLSKIYPYCSCRG